MSLPKQKRTLVTEYLETLLNPIHHQIKHLGKDSAGKDATQLSNHYIERLIQKPLELRKYTAVINPDTPNKATVVWIFEGNYTLLGYAAPDGTSPDKTSNNSFSEIYEFPESIVASSKLRDEVADRIKQRDNFLQNYVNQLNTAVTSYNLSVRQTIPPLIAERLKIINDAKATEDFLNKKS